MDAVLNLSLDYFVEFSEQFWVIYFIGRSYQKELNVDQI